MVNAWSPVGGIAWEELWGVALLEWCDQGQFEVSNDSHYSRYSVLCLFLLDQEVRFQLRLLPCLCSAVMDFDPLKP